MHRAAEGLLSQWRPAGRHEGQKGRKEAGKEVLDAMLQEDPPAGRPYEPYKSYYKALESLDLIIKASGASVQVITWGVMSSKQKDRNQQMLGGVDFKSMDLRKRLAKKEAKAAEEAASNPGGEKVVKRRSFKGPKSAGSTDLTQ